MPSSADALTASADRWTLNGSHRTRYSRLLNQFRPGFSGDDQALALRTALHAELALPRLSLIGELQDARAYLTDEQSAVSTAVVNALDILQAYVRIDGDPAPATRGAEVWLGRFIIELGSGRLVAAEPYRDVARGHTGALARWPLAGDAELTAFGVLPVLIEPSDHQGLLDNEIELDRSSTDLKFFGLMYARRSRPFQAGGELYVFALDERDDAGERETRDRRLVTAGFRVYRNPARGRWDFETENAWQSGTARATSDPADVRDLDVVARFHHLQIGYMLKRRWSPRISVEYEYGSGEADPNDGKWRRFDMLFGNRRFDLAPTSIYGALGRENIDTLGVRLSLTPSARTDAFAVYRVVRLAEATDFFASTGVRDPTGAAGRYGGRQLDVRVRRQLVPGVLRLDTGVTHLWAGHFLRNAPNATRAGDTTFFYGDITYAFGSGR